MNGISSVEWGGNVSSENKNKGFTHAITMTFDDHKAISSYFKLFQTIYTLHLSSCYFVGCTRSPRSQSYLCSRGFTPLPSRSILKSIGYIPPSA
ncbi:Dabb family protein [Photorhabdus heterorhabditis]|uniref:Dabb family protein n=1 Tax=Photorhabdus heterorhabditis TaxID=880156 RepID=UPI001BD2C1BE